MCNCGKKRSSSPVQSQQRIVAKPHPFLASASHTILFQYVGNTALSIIGRSTRKSYRFNFPGDIKPVAIADAPDMKAVPVLKLVE
jgi:hypothetical protein